MASREHRMDVGDSPRSWDNIMPRVRFKEELTARMAPHATRKAQRAVDRIGVSDFGSGIIM